jgi:glycerate-2-kinase
MREEGFEIEGYEKVVVVGGGKAGVAMALESVLGDRLTQGIVIISDVVGDRLDTIASGPTYPDSTTYSDALTVLSKYELKEKVPPGVLAHLANGVRGLIPETPKAGEECFRTAYYYYKIIASNADALAAAEEVGRAHGFNVHILTTTMQGEARQVGEYLSRVAREVYEMGRPIPRPALLLLGGETTVTVKGEGTGGRNQELALSTALGIVGLDTAVIVSFSTDGIDGPTDAAGAVADGFTTRRAEQLGLDPALYLENNDSYSFFKELGDLVVTGPTGTNVMDVVALIAGQDGIEERPAVSSAENLLAAALGMRHHPQHIPRGISYPGDVGERAIRIGCRGDLSGGG